MENAETIVQKFHQRKSVVNIKINAKIKHLQQRLVTISFAGGNNTPEYSAVLEEIKQLRDIIFERV